MILTTKQVFHYREGGGGVPGKLNSSEDNYFVQLV